MQAKSHLNLKKLLLLLADNETHSGEEIAQLLGVTRAAIWKQIRKIINLGFDVESLHGQGYRLTQKLDLLRDEFLCNELNKRFDLKGEIFWEIDSTNNELLRRVQLDKSLALNCIVAETQTAGRGRRGKKWVSPLGKNLYFSLSCTFDTGIVAIEGLSLVIGIALTEALRSLGFERVQLKWPNDILCDGKKLGGILLDIVGEPNGICHVIIGIGINVYKADLINASIDQPWTTLDEIMPDADLDRTGLLLHFIKAIMSNIEIFHAEGFSPFHQMWESYDGCAGKEVVISHGSQIEFGVEDGITPAGELILKTAHGRKTFMNGEVSLRVKL